MGLFTDPEKLGARVSRDFLVDGMYLVCVMPLKSGPIGFASNVNCTGRVTMLPASVHCTEFLKH
jgi:hypothetical protein